MSFSLLPTAIGSLPNVDPKEAVRLILGYLPQIPAWPQLPKKSFLESMYVQFSEGLPNLKVEQLARKVWVDTAADFEAALAEFYEHYLANDIDYFKIGRNCAAGFYEFTQALRSNPPGEIKHLKGQVTGPISLGLSLTDQNKRAILYNEGLSDALVKLLAMKAKWQIRELRKLHPDIIIFIDEPYLVSIGSSFVSLNRPDVLRWLNEIIDAIHAGDAIAGIHCCGNTDWSLLMDTRSDIISFDAYNYSGDIALYADKLKSFFERGGTLAWGIVPTSAEAEKEDVNTLGRRLKRSMDALSERGISIEMLKERALLTPSCGMGTLSIEKAERCLELLKGLSIALHK